MIERIVAYLEVIYASLAPSSSDVVMATDKIIRAPAYKNKKNARSMHISYMQLTQSSFALTRNTMPTQTITAVPSTTKPREPLQLKGALNQYQSFDVTPVIGREFVDVNLVDWLRAPNADELLRDLAITSKTDHLPSVLSDLITCQFLSVESSSSASKMG